MNRTVAELRINLRRIVRLCMLRRVPHGGRPVHPAFVVLALAVGLVMTALVSFFSAGPDPYFSEWAIATFAAKFGLFAILITVLTTGKLRAPVSRAVIDFSGISIVAKAVVLAYLLIWLAFARQIHENSIPTHYIWYGLSFAITIWSVAAAWTAGTRLWGEPVRLAGLRLLLAAMIPLLLIPRTSMFDGPYTDSTRVDLWYWGREAFRSDYAEEAAASEAPRIDYEQTLYNQRRLVEAAVSKFKPSFDEQSQFYFLGFAPSSAHTVFRDEVAGAEAAFTGRYGSKGRSMIMINSPETLTAFPMANVSNLEMALEGFAKVMRPDKDILALFVTSHGNAGTISVSFPGFPLNQLDTQSLAKALDHSGIKNRVIIISACYSGSFVPALANENTLVMTASGADKTSFGCSNEREWTYFGDAFFNHALKQTSSLPEAFGIARDLIIKWEAEQKLTPSEPQISIGAKIGKLLESMDKPELPETSLHIN